MKTNSSSKEERIFTQNRFLALTFLLFILSIFVCPYLPFHTKEAIVFLDKNASEFPVWKEILQQDIVHLEDAVKAFDAYASAHDLDHETKEHYEKLFDRMRLDLDVEGNYISEKRQYENLMAYRKALPKTIAEQEEYDLSKAFFFFDVPNPTGKGSWKNIGPFGNPEVHWSATGNGALQYLEMHPSNPAIMYACSRNGGLWRTTNYAKHWEPLTQYFATPHTSCIEVCPADPSILYLGAAQDKIIWYSNDEGTTWSNRSTGLDGEIYDVHSDPTDAARVLAATTTGIYLTTDSGLNWTQKIAGEFTDIDLNTAWDFIIVTKNEPNTPSTLFFSQDKGTTWTEKNIITTPATVDKFYLALHQPAVGPIVVYAYGMEDGNTPSRFIGLWKSDFDPAPGDGVSFFNFIRVEHPTYAYPNGAVPLRWTSTAPGYEEDLDYYGSINPYTSAAWISDFWVSPNNPDRLLTLREKFWGSDDGGIIWDQKPQYGGATWADNRFATMNTAQDTFYWCNDGGMWSIKESDLFPTPAEVTASGLSKVGYINSKVVPKNGDICVSEGTQMDVSQMNKAVFITGGQDIGQIFVRNGRDTHAASADIYRGRIKPTDDSKFITGALNVKLDGGSDTYRVYNNMEADHFNGDRLYGYIDKNITTGVNTTLLARSPAGLDGWDVVNFKGENQANSGGGSWTATNDAWETVDISSTGIATQKTGTFEQSRANPEIAFLGDEVGNRLFITNNLSAATPTWTQLSNAPAASRYRMATHQYNENIIVIATNQGVYISKDKGVSWYKRDGIPESDPKVVLLDKNKTEGIYVMTALNVYYIDESLDSWAEFNKGLPLHKNQDMRIGYYGNGDNRLYVAKYGMGVWVSPLQSILDNNADMPVADFTIHGTSTGELNVGETIKLADLSLNAETLSWVIENGGDVINIGDLKEPQAVLNTAGYYKVTLTATNTNGSSMKIKEQYIHVSTLVNPICTPLNDGTFPFYKGLDDITVNGDNYNVPTLEYFVDSGWKYRATIGNSTSFYVDDNYVPGFNFYIKAWIDYNNDGDFDDAGEEIADSGGQVESITTSFTPPANAVVNTPLNMRVSGRESSSPPSNCNNFSTRQTVDFKIILSNNIQFTSSHTILTTNSASLQTSFTDALNVFEAGFVYSRFDGNLNLENSSKIKHLAALTNNDNYTETLADLEFNATYYYKPYIIDDGGVHYGTKQNFQLSTSKIPLSESIIAMNYTGDEWVLRGKVFPEGNTLTSVAIEHGENGFVSTEAIDISGTNANDNFEIEATVTLMPAITTYKFRLKVIVNGKTYYSNVHVFHPGQTICTPTVNASIWYKRFGTVELNGVTHTESSSSDYEDVTSSVFYFDAGNTYTLTATGISSSWHNLTYLIYIDLNNDKDFDDYHEWVGTASPNGTHITPVNFTIPTKNIVAGQNLRMRVIGYESSPTSVCGLQIGNIKDFTAYIKPTSIAAKAFFEGAYDAGLMKDDLRSASLIPTNEPYTALGFTHINGGGGESCAASVFNVTGNNAIIDWVLVELRDKSAAGKIQYTRSALIQKDGDIVDVDGTSALTFPRAKADDYFIAVRHRNHLGVMALNLVTLSSTAATIDFSSVATYGTNAQKDMGGGVMALWAGDADFNNQVQNTDYLLHWKPNAGTAGYQAADFDMNGQVQNTDYLLLWKLNAGLGAQLP